MYASTRAGRPLMVYHYAGTPDYKGLYEDFQARSDGSLIARFRWLNNPAVSGLLVLAPVGSDLLVGAWWRAVDVPQSVWVEPKGLDPGHPAGNPIRYVRVGRDAPIWAAEILRSLGR